jgi:cell division protein FtsW
MVKYYKIDKFLIIVTALLIMLGLIMIYSSTMILAKEVHADSFYFLKRQLLWLVMGLIASAVIVFLKNPLYLNQKFVFLVLFLALVGLILVFFTGKINNSYRWIRIAGLSLQPSEFAKIAVIMYLSFVLSRKNNDVNNISKLLIYLSPVFVVGILILKEPDYGNFFLILLLTLIMLFIAGLKIRYLVFAAVSISPVLYLIIRMNPERMNRILAFLNPEAYFSTYGYQALQSIYAIGCGGPFGQGLGNSTQKLYFLPYAYSDFIFSIIAEELGLLGSLAFICLFIVFLLRGLIIAKQSGNLHTYLLVVGLTFLVVIQAMMNISVATGILPTKGIPLPFISIGGTSLIANLIIVGIILNISRHRKMVFIND